MNKLDEIKQRVFKEKSSETMDIAQCKEDREWLLAYAELLIADFAAIKEKSDRLYALVTNHKSAH